jgi:septal ring factor EnvC (AmiA/AmiB activator)
MMSAEVAILEKRQDRMETVIERLSVIQTDLNKMLAVHEERINSNQKNVTYLEEVVEKRREESDIKLKDVYETMRSEDGKILSELNSIRKESTEQHNELSAKINEIEKRLWMYIGAVSVIVFVLTHTDTIIKILK